MPISGLRGPVSKPRHWFHRQQHAWQTCRCNSGCSSGRSSSTRNTTLAGQVGAHGPDKCVEVTQGTEGAPLSAQQQEVDLGHVKKPAVSLSGGVEADGGRN
jgi:hypothetical protein